ncbi:trans-resveratrol di-O-methyltransferase-like [Papaver somniferum]|uniref:trans-resveratrol di-O-methyltransferase-like n=1 Tax=Papaver somniferum TaxID=3469 RepID=UPI000E6F4E85|nr:trans-resveratrol di-O-methyltransferase-like [Papaver somniferum]
MDSTSQELKTNELMQAQTQLYMHALSFAKSMAIKCVVELGIPNIIHSHGKPMPLYSLVDALSLPPTKTEYLNRLMRLMVYSGIFSTESLEKNQEDKGYILTATSKLLINTTKTTSSAVIFLIDPFTMSPFYFLSAWFRGSGSTPFEAAHGMTIWNALEQNPEIRKTFHDAMAGDSGLLMSVIVNEGKRVFENLKSLVDVGGGTGATAQALVEAFPNLECMVLDLPNVIADLPGATNIVFIGGDMFDSIPRADAVLMKTILHDWNDMDCVKILQKCREAIPSRQEGGKVIIIDAVMNEDYIENKQKQDSITETQLLLDIAVMGGPGGKERTEKEWEKLFLESDFSGYKIICTLGFRSLIEVYP